MQEILKLDFGVQSVITLVELDDCAIDSARKAGWSLVGVFEAERRQSRYSTDTGGKALFGVYRVPTDAIVSDAVKRAEEAEKKRDDAEREMRKAKQAETEAAQRMVAMMSEIEDMRRMLLAAASPQQKANGASPEATSK
jgi:hypothetical protein